MSDPLQAILGPLGLAPTAFPPTSRYNGVPIATVPASDGTAVAYLTRRFVPRPDAFRTFQTVTVHDGDRLDRLAAQHLGDPLAFWRLCDANGAVRPDELIERAGRTLRLTLPAPPGGGTGA